MALELNLEFPHPEKVLVRLADAQQLTLPFASPLSEEDFKAVHWYVEVYPTIPSFDVDDDAAQQIANGFPDVGRRLFDAVFSDTTASLLFADFYRDQSAGRLLSVSARDPQILALPWELLHHQGAYLTNAHPPISIRRRVSGKEVFWHGPHPVRAPRRKRKQRLHILFVVCRPDAAGFIDPRADPQAVLDALDRYAPDRYTIEFLRPGTFDGLVRRLDDNTLPPVDVVHFDGHGVFDSSGRIAEGLKGDYRTSGAEFRVRRAEAEPEAKTGYLVFEGEDAATDVVSAEAFGLQLTQRRIPLVILSACQSAAYGTADKVDPQGTRGDADAEPLGCVAARLTLAGIPSVLAMTHTVLVATTQRLFGEFYANLAQGRAIGESLDRARNHLMRHPEKHRVPRLDDDGGGIVMKRLELYDWFVPALYQCGEDGPLLAKGQTPPAAAPPDEPLDRFFGRQRELWDVQRWFTSGVRRVAVTGFGGQGKTRLARELGSWLTRTGMFAYWVFVDYSRYQGGDPVEQVLAACRTELPGDLVDLADLPPILQERPTLLVLDNVEALPQQPLAALLEAAEPWSECGGSRVLLTTRMPEFPPRAYRESQTARFRRLALGGLGERKDPEPALVWFGHLFALPPLPPAPRLAAPARAELIGLFDRVGFHPLSIRVLAQQLKTRPIHELGPRLETLLAQGATAGLPSSAGEFLEGTPPALIASLHLSLDRLDPESRKLLPRLGVFQGGATEPMILQVLFGQPSTETSDAEPGEAESRPHAGAWPVLRAQLEAAALIEAESLPGLAEAFLKFHPTLAPILWAELSDAAGREELLARYRQQYASLAREMYFLDDKNPGAARAVAGRELPNLLRAVQVALRSGDQNSVDFVDSVNRFLTYFGRNREAEELTERAQEGVETGSEAWYLARSNLGERHLAVGRVVESRAVFDEILATLGPEPSYHRCLTLARLGRCCHAAKQLERAAELQRQALCESDQLEPTPHMLRAKGNRYTDLANVLTDMGQFAAAREAYEDSLALLRSVGDERGQGAALGQLGTLAMIEGDLPEAARRFQDALELFRRLDEPVSVATAWHQLGRVYQKAGQWEASERHYKESARINEQRGDLATAATSYNQLANVSTQAGKPQAAERWYAKAIDVFRRTSARPNLASGLNNLAYLLADQPTRQGEARQYAEEALAIKSTLDPGASQIWTTYAILADIADREGDRVSARDYRRQARQAKWAFAGTRYELRRYGPLIAAAVAALGSADTDSRARQALGVEQKKMRDAGGEWPALADALDRLLANPAIDENDLFEELHYSAATFLMAVQQGMADPSQIADLLENRPEER